MSKLLLVDDDANTLASLARAFRWQKMLETGGNATIKEIAHTLAALPMSPARTRAQLGF